jgi:hypothetical protein
VGLGDHPAVADEHDLLDPEVLLDHPHGVCNGLLIGDVALVHAHTDRAAVRPADQPVVDLRLALHTIARVAQSRQRAAAPFHVARGQVVEHERVAVAVAGEVSARERPLDPVLALKQPVRRRQQLGLLDLAERQLIAERGLRKAPRR